MIVRIYTRDDGHAHFDDMELPPGEVETTGLKARGKVTFHRNPDGRFADWHNPPWRRYVIIMSGQMEVGIGDGTVRRFGPGSVILVEDLTGKGHTTKILGSESPSLFMIVPLEG